MNINTRAPDDIFKMYLNDLSRSKDQILLNDPKEVLKKIKKISRLEKQFNKLLNSSKQGQEVYLDFCRMINVHFKNVLYARSYFRIREDQFKTRINPLITKNEYKKIYSLPLNYKFCVYALKNVKNISTAHSQTLHTMLSDMTELRNKVIIGYTYLAVSRAKVFFNNNTFKGNELSDFIQSANEALVESVDKFDVKANKSNFHNVAFGKIFANLLVLQHSYNSASSLGSSGIKQLAQILNKMKQLNNNATTKELSEMLNVAEEEINLLLNSSKYIDLDAFVGNDANGSFVKDRFSIDDGQAAYKDTELTDFNKKANIAVNDLSIIEKKILKLKGVLE